MNDSIGERTRSMSKILWKREIRNERLICDQNSDDDNEDDNLI